MILDKKETEKLIGLLDDIRSWMLSNDYVCTVHGSKLYDRIYDMSVSIDPTLSRDEEE